MKIDFIMVDVTKGDYTISTNPSRMDALVVHSYLSRSYWSPGISLEKVSQAMNSSLCFGVFREDQQVGFARVITDITSFAYLADVFMLEEHRGLGLARWLMETITEHPQLQELRRFMLATRDAHKLYGKFGFEALKQPDWVMQKS